MSQMILSKPGRIWNSDGEVCEDGEQSIEDACSESKVMTDFMNGEEKILICSSSNNVGCEQESPGEDRGIFKEVCADNLEKDDGGNQVFGQRFRAAQLEDFLMGFYDCLSTSPMGFFGVCPEELVFR